MPQTPTLTIADALEAERLLCARSFAYFIKRAWPNVIPDKLQWNWHIEAIADHLQAIHEGHFNRLLLNVPPGTSKSTITGVMYPAWLWGPGGHPGHRYIGASHEQNLAVRDNRMMRELIRSDWYQRLWPTKLTTDQNEKLYFENDRRGFRQACAVASMTGRRGHTVAWDDPLTPEKANSPVEREKTIRIFTETLPHRLNDPDRSAIVVVMQRLHEEDPSGFILSKELGWEHLCIPMEYEGPRPPTSIGWVDPRKEDGELLDPVRFPPSVIKRDKEMMGGYAWAGQMQQRPSPRQGGLFLVDKLRFIPDIPDEEIKWVEGWDLAGSDEKENRDAAYTARVEMGYVARTKRFVVAMSDRRRVSAGAVEEWVGKRSGELVDGSMKMVLPQDPGQAGKAQKARLAQVMAGARFRFELQSGDKETRASPFAAQVEHGNVDIVQGPWNSDFVEELRQFPMGKYKDQVDAASSAFNELIRMIRRPDDDLSIASSTVKNRARAY